MWKKNLLDKGFTSTYHNVWNEIRKHGKCLHITRGVRRGNHCIYLHLLCLRHLRGSGVMKPRRSPTDSPRGEVTQREEKEGWVDSTRPPADLTKWVDRRGITGLTRQGRAAYRSARTSWSAYQQANSFDWSHINSCMWFVSFLLKWNGTGFVVSGRQIKKKWVIHAKFWLGKLRGVKLGQVGIGVSSMCMLIASFDGTLSLSLFLLSLCTPKTQVFMERRVDTRQGYFHISPSILISSWIYPTC